MLTKTLVAAATALAASTAMNLPANAAPNTQVRSEVIFWLLDRNGDGQIDKSEIEALRTVIFNAVDTNGDGKVTRDEFMAVIGDRGGPPEMRGDRQDGPHHGWWKQQGDRRDGRRGPGYAEQGRGPGPRGDQFAEGPGPGPRHDEWQGNGPQGGPRGDQFAQGRGPGPRHDEWQGNGPQGGPRGDQFAEGRGPGPRHDEWQGNGPHGGPGDRMMKRLGIDANNGLNKDDFVAAIPKVFDRADTDHNGELSQSEFEQASRYIGRLLILG